MEVAINKRSLKDILFLTLDKVLDGDATPEMVEQVCYLSEQMIKDDKNSIEVEKARMYMEIEREDRMTQATMRLTQVIESAGEYEDDKKSS
jgi:hypothetical protein